MLFLEAVKALHKMRTTAAVQEKVFSVVFSSMVRLRRGIATVRKVTGPFPIALFACRYCRMRFKSERYAESCDPDQPLTDTHFDLLTGVAAVAAVAFETASLIEVLRAENLKLVRDLWLQRDLIGESPAMAELSKITAKAAPTNSTILIQGETGTGKELIARTIHKNSRRADGAFVAVNCAAIAENLLESELFGHEQGAFTGANAQKKGQFELAAGGTLFLDELGELSLSIQAKLLRAIQEREINRIGGARPIPIDIRLIAATNRDLEAAVERNEFRQDLLHRLKVITIKSPALRDRKTDIPILARHFVQVHSKGVGRLVRGLSPDAEALLIDYDWPGNVRELQNVIERAIVLGSGDLVLPEDLPSELFEAAPGNEDIPKFHNPLVVAKREAFKKAVVQADGDPKRAAEILGVHPRSMYRMAHNLKLTSFLKA